MTSTTTVIAYIVYLIVSIALTVWVARTLFKNGRIFLVDVFKGSEELADSVNQLLIVGFYLISLGYVSLALKMGKELPDARVAIEALSWKLGLVLLVLGGMHFLNLYIFSRMRRPKHQSPPPRIDQPLTGGAWQVEQPVPGKEPDRVV